MWDKLNQLSKMDQMFTMDEIIESIEEGEMPPEDHIKEHPEAALTKEEAKTLIEWADAIATKLLD
jgi:exonuclease VII small subunit